MSEVPLAGRSAAVTGASRGIGLATARSLAASGARVALLARSAEALHEQALSIGRDALPIPCDLRDATQLAAAIDILVGTFDGPPDILVLNAGVFTLGKVGALPPADFSLSLQTNLIGPYTLLHALVPLMRKRGSGHIVTIGSIADRAAYPENSAYAAAKFATRGVHEVLRVELAGSGVRASLVSPGPVDTSLWDPIQPDARQGFTPRALMLQAEAVADAVLWVVTRPSDVNVDELRLSRT
ncbi:MAG: SDR family oxidoreductase [Gemmatimonadota bacterium]